MQAFRHFCVCRYVGFSWYLSGRLLNLSIMNSFLFVVILSIPRWSVLLFGGCCCLLTDVCALSVPSRVLCILHSTLTPMSISLFWHFKLVAEFISRSVLEDDALCEL